MSDMAKNLILWLVIAVVLMLLFQSFGPSDSSGRRVDYSSFITEISQNQISEVRISGRDIDFTKKDNGGKYSTYMPVQDE
ncbi:ATP-dependent metallopeptidase FtsH/Yme1/Tma family protein, partial [Enterobacter hormaechei]|nr:ATP-dependent metallopeptidase FtsH/Yme1/Tma family protein [Enterobacter hormaechei]